MDNYVERESYRIARHLLAFFDPRRLGWCLDAGTGNDNFWFEDLWKSGWKTVVVDPLPTKAVEERCTRWKLPLVRAALGAQTGVGTIYTDGAELYSLDPARWVTPMDLMQRVAVMTLRTVVADQPIPFWMLSLLKLDIEGAECDVLEGLCFPDLLKPPVVVFEFGGQTRMKDKTGPWAPDRFAQLVNMLQRLARFGYKKGFAVQEGAGPLSEPFLTSEGLTFLNPDTAWGNIVIFRDPSVDDMKRWL